MLGGMGRHHAFVLSIVLLLSGCASMTPQVRSEAWTLAKSALDLVHAAIAETEPLWDEYVHTRMAHCESLNIPSDELEERRKCMGHAAHAGKVAAGLEKVVRVQKTLKVLLEASEPDSDRISAQYLRLLAVLPEVFRTWVLAGDGVCRGSCSQAAALWP